MSGQLVSLEGFPVGVDHVLARQIWSLELVPGDAGVLLDFDHASDFVAFSEPFLCSDVLGEIPDLNRRDSFGTECLEQLVVGTGARRLFGDDNYFSGHCDSFGLGLQSNRGTAFLK